jgi:hypothetical protein
MLAILATALVILAASFIAGRAFLYVLGRTHPTWLAGAVGFAILVTVCPLLIRLPGRATTATILLLLALLIALGVMRRRFFAERQAGGGDSPGPAAPRAAHQAALTTVLITLALAGLPFLFNQSTGVLGEGIYTNDQAAQLYWTDWLQHGVGPEPAAVRFGYPTGPQSLTAVAATATGSSLEHAFNGLLLAIPALAALAALSALGELAPRRRVAAAVIVGLPYLAASFLAQSAFKETAMGLFVLALAIVLSEVGRLGVPRRAVFGSLLVLATASVFTYSLPAVAWFGLAIPIWAVLELVRGDLNPRAGFRRASEALRRHRLAVVVGVALLAAVAILGAGSVSHFFDKIAKVQGSPGRLGSPISPGEALGVWPQGDFTIVRGQVAGALPAIVLGLAAVALGALVALRRREHALLAGLAAGAAVYVGARLEASIYVQAKALAVIAPLVAFVALKGLLGSDLARDKTRPRSTRANILVIVGVLFTLGAAVSTLGALRAAPVGFDNRTRDLEMLGEAVEGRSVVFLGLDRFAAYWLRGTLIRAPGGYVPPEVKPRRDKVWYQGYPTDFDTLPPSRLDDFEYAITTTAAFQSSPPPNMRLKDSQGDYELWKRVGKTPKQRVLDEGLAPGVTLDCNSPKGSALHAQDGSATVLPTPVLGTVADWSRSSPFDAPGSASQTLDLTPGRWRLSLQYHSQAGLEVSGSKQVRAGLPPSLDGMYFSHQGQGAFWPAGEVKVTNTRPVTVTVSAAEPSGLQRLLGVRRRVWLGNLAASPVRATRSLPLSASCSDYVDHYVLSGYPR